MSKKAIGINAFLQRKFVTYDFEGKFKASFGYPEKNFKMFVSGKSGNGKTSFCVQFAKYMARFTTVFYNSFEEGISKSLQDAVRRENLQEVNGKIMFGKLGFNELIERLNKPRSEQVIIIDSRDYINLSQAQYIQLVEKFPRKSFIITSWAENGKPKGKVNQAIEYMVDIKILVENHVAYPRCRYGGNVEYVIWERKVAVAKKVKKSERNVFDEMPSIMTGKGNAQACLMLTKENGMWRAFYQDVMNDNVWVESEQHFQPELALSDLRFKM